jgi:hypothetical protein
MSLLDVVFEQITADETAEKSRLAKEALAAQLRMEESRWQRQLDRFRYVPENISVETFSGNAEALYLSGRFESDLAAQEVFRAVVEAHPKKLRPKCIREYLNKYPQDDQLGKFYISQFLEISHSEDRDLKKNGIWAVMGSLYVLAAVVDKEHLLPGRERALESMKKFCGMVLKRFPDLPEGLQRLFEAVGRSGFLQTVDHRPPRGPASPQDIAKYTVKGGSVQGGATIAEQLQAKGVSVRMDSQAA